MKKAIFIIGGLAALGAAAFFVVSNMRATPKQTPEILNTNSASSTSAGGTQSGVSPETRYLAFQMFTGEAGLALPIGGSATFSSPPDKAFIASFVDSVVNTIGTTGDDKQKLGFFLGPISFDHSDAEIKRMISDAFAVAEEKNVAVGFHIDDSMFWAKRTDLWQNPKNVEWSDWNGTIFSHRYVDWIPVPLAPQMCYNNPGIKQAVSIQAHNVIGSAIAQGLARLKSVNKEYLFAGVIAGWETHLADYSYYGKMDPNVAKLMEQDNAPKVRIGYCALSNLGYNAANPPANIDGALDGVVKDFAALWAKELNGAGIPKDKIYTHIAALNEKLAAQNFPLDVIAKHFGITNPSYSALSRHSLPSNAFNDYSRPGFSTYPSPGTIDGIYDELSRHPAIGWASSEGTNVIPGQGADSSGMNMETYLARMFNHGATLVDIFSWGLGGDAIKNTNPFRIVTEGPEAIAAYKKFLGGGETKESAIKNGGTSAGLPDKLKKIRENAPAWLATHADQKSKVDSLTAKLETYISAGNPASAEQTADEILRLIGK